MSWPVPIKTAAVPAWLRLGDVLAEAGPVACQGQDADWWTSEDAEEREAATYRCAGCPALAACDEYADMAGERWSVWAGVDRTPRRDRPEPFIPLFDLTKETA